MKVVITGGPYSGKTTLVNALANLNYKILPEVAIQVIQNKINELGMASFLCWRSSHLIELQSTILTIQSKNESALSLNEITVLDRGTIDNLAYLHLNKITPPVAMLNKAKQAHYDLVIVCETLNNFDERVKTGRTETYGESIRLQKIIAKTYINLGYKTIFLPQAPLVHRVNEICTLLNSDIS